MQQDNTNNSTNENLIQQSLQRDDSESENQLKQILPNVKAIQPLPKAIEKPVTVKPNKPIIQSTKPITVKKQIIIVKPPIIKPLIKKVIINKPLPNKPALTKPIQKLVAKPVTKPLSKPNNDY